MTDAISRSNAISRSAALSMMDEYIDMARDEELHHAMCVVAAGLAELPTLDVAPVVHAAWLPVCEMWDDGIECDEDWYVKCSRCGRENYNVDVYKVMDGNLEKVKRDFPYCHCGARMDGEADV